LTHVAQQRGVPPLKSRLLGISAAGKAVGKQLQDIVPVSTGQGSIVQAWPSPEIYNQPAKNTVNVPYKCHDAVTYWLLLSLGFKDDGAQKVLRAIHDKYGSSSNWAAKFLGYDEKKRITSEKTEVPEGSIIFFGSVAHPTHSCVVTQSGQNNNQIIVGFNNQSVFGTNSVDTYSFEFLGNPYNWHGDEFGMGYHTRQRCYYVSYDEAAKVLAAMIQTVGVFKNTWRI
jgi:hypothetical protein